MVKARLLRKMIPGASVLWDPISQDLSLDTPLGGWETQTVAGSAFVYVYRFSYFDLSGIKVNQETLFPQGVSLQQIQAVKGTGSYFYRIDLATKEPIQFSDIDNFLTTGVPAPPGSLASDTSLEQIFMGRLQLWEELSTISGLAQSQETVWGVGDATAGEKLYLTTAFLIDITAMNAFNIPEGAWVIPSVIDKEEDLEYIMRMKRSYETQG